MEGEAISATIEVLVQNLINLSKDEISLIQSLDENAEKLRDTFGMIQGFLDDAQKKFVPDEAVKKWLKSLEKKAFDADNALDELNYQLLSQNVSSCFPSFNHYVDRRDLALEINKINSSFESVNKNAMELGLQEKLAVAPAAADAVLETDSFTVDPIFIGRDDDVLKIVQMLTTPTEEAVSILPIVGMGGLGKTTLARNVFNHQKTKNHFGKLIWVHVSQDFNALVLLKKILRNVKEGNVEDESREVLLKKLQESSESQNDDAAILLKRKLTNLEGGNVQDESRDVVMKKIKEALKTLTYLLVLDDVWNEDRQKWEDFIRSWSGITSTKGNIIIVTTRNVEVGAIVKTLDMHLLHELSDEQCWSIIKDRALEGEVITPDLEDIGRSIAKRCTGLPLAANVVGGVLRGKSRDEWSAIKESWLSDVGGDENYISKILKLSFHHLPSPSLKKCFAYCSIFPKGARINREQLIQLWMAEGFLQPSQTSDMETVGNQLLKVLLHNSLLQIVDRDEYGNIEHCSMHDLVHDVAVSISDVTYYKRDESREDPKEQAKWYTCWGNNGGESRRIPKDNAKWLRTLVYNGKICDIIFSDFKSLHSLTLSDDVVEKLSDSIRELKHLRYLDISDTNVEYLPNAIGKLYHLQTIRAGWLLSLPSTLKHLLNLRHIYVKFEYVLLLPAHLGMLTSLQTLPCFKVHNKEGHRIVELGSLKNLKGELKIYNLEKVRGEEESEKACLSQKSGIVRLVLRWDENREGVQINDENVLKGLQPHPNLKKLEIYGFSGASFPTWTSKMAVFLQGCWVGLSSLMEMTLGNCSGCEEIPTLGHLPHLKVLCLYRLDKVKLIGASYYGIEECSPTNGVTITVFPALKRLELRELPELREWEEVKVPQVNAFPCLEHLKIRECNQLRSAPSQFTSLKELIIGVMDSELPLASICDIKLKTLTKLEIQWIEGLTSLPDWLFHNNQNFSVLTIRDCPKLIELSNGMHNLSSVEELLLSDCDNLKSVSGGKLQDLTSLRKLTISGFPGLKNFLVEMGESCAPLLEYVHIDAGGPHGLDRASFNKTINRVLVSRSHSLRTLELTGNLDWESLPDQIQHLTALEMLQLYEFGIKELPEWLGNLSSLKELYLLGCRKLTTLEDMRRLINLTTLVIRGCPLLNNRGYIKQCEWPKISHIPNIELDWHDIQNNGR